jgi:flagella basal body P-ring formation protein FlgA
MNARVHIRLAALVFVLSCVAGTAFAADADDRLGLRSMIEASVRSELDSVRAIEIPSLERLVPDLPDDELGLVRVDIAFMGPVRGGRLGLRVSLSRDDRLLKRSVVNVRVDGEREVVVPTRLIRSREKIGREDVELVAVPLSNIRSEALTDLDEVVGQRARRSLREGRPIASASLELSPDVVRGQRVKLQLRKGALRIEAVGRAQEDGRRGEWVRVLNTSSRREVLGRVAQDGVVHVDL